MKANNCGTFSCNLYFITFNITPKRRTRENTFWIACTSAHGVSGADPGFFLGGGAPLRKT